LIVHRRSSFGILGTYVTLLRNFDRHCLGTNIDRRLLPHGNNGGSGEAHNFPGASVFWEQREMQREAALTD
jgi:hypothetical protein